jgi:hypothetical protein
MTMEEFYEALYACHNQFKWDTGKYNPFLRGYVPAGNICCPLTAVAMVRLRQHFRTWDASIAAQNLGLNARDSYAIIQAADEEYDPETGLEEGSIAIRTRLLACVGLAEESKV